ncbi:uncharacterized protein METZ01_LOCUS270469, partial [marine metagenome]
YDSSVCSHKSQYGNVLEFPDLNYDNP